MAHHVVEDSTALEAPLPEPRHVGTAVLLGGTSKIGTAGQRCAARPNQFASAGNVGGEQLILEIPGIQTDTARQIGHSFCLGEVSRERLFACESSQSTGAALDRADNLFDVRDSRVIGSAE